MDPYDGKGLLKTAIRDPNPVIIFEHKLLYGSKGSRKEACGMQLVMHVPEEEYLIPFGQANWFARATGRPLWPICSWCIFLFKLLKCWSRKESRSKSFDPRTLVPLDEQTIFTLVQKTGRLVIVEEIT